MRENQIENTEALSVDKRFQVNRLEEGQQLIPTVLWDDQRDQSNWVVKAE